MARQIGNGETNGSAQGSGDGGSGNNVSGNGVSGNGGQAIAGQRIASPRHRSCTAATRLIVEQLQEALSRGSRFRRSANGMPSSPRLNDDPVAVEHSAAGPAWKAASLAYRGQRRTGLGARRQLARDREGDRPPSSPPRRPTRRPTLAARDQSRQIAGSRGAGDARFGARADDDPRLSHARPSACQARSARPGAAEGF